MKQVLATLVLIKMCFQRVETCYTIRVHKTGIKCITATYDRLSRAISR